MITYLLYSKNPALREKEKAKNSKKKRRENKEKCEEKGKPQKE